MSLLDTVETELAGGILDRSGIGSVFGGSLMFWGLPMGADAFGEAIDRPGFLERILGWTVAVGGLRMTGFVAGPTTKPEEADFGAGDGM